MKLQVKTAKMSSFNKSDTKHKIKQYQQHYYYLRMGVSVGAAARRRALTGQKRDTVGEG